MPRSRKTEDMSAPTVLKWLKVYHVELVKMVKEGRVYEAEGKRAIKGLRYAIKALDESYVKYRRDVQASKRKAEAEAFEESLDLEV